MDRTKVAAPADTMIQDTVRPPWITPQLVRMGSIGEVTGTVGTTGAADGGGMGMNRTSP